MAWTENELAPYSVFLVHRFSNFFAKENGCEVARLLATEHVVNQPLLPPKKFSTDPSGQTQRDEITSIISATTILQDT